jgi:hypothetical protein
MDIISLLSKASDLARPNARDILPVGSLALLIAGLIIAGAPGRVSVTKALGAASHLSIASFGLLILTVAAMSILLQPLIFGLVAIIQDKAQDAITRSISERLSRRHRIRRDKTRERLLELYRNEQQGTINAAEQRELEALAVRLRQYPSVGRVRSTSLGNTLAAAEEDAGRPYGLDSRVALPRLEPLLPESAAKELNSRRTDCLFASRFCATLLLTTIASGLLLAGDGIWLTVPAIFLVFAWLSYKNAISATVVYGETLRVQFELHRLLLYKAYQLPQPSSLQEERQLGEQLSLFFRTGFRKSEPYFYNDKVNLDLDQK